MSRVRKAALLCASRIGDFICATPAFRALRAGMPETEFTLIGLPFLADLVERCPYVDRFEKFPGFPGIAEQFFDARRCLAFLNRMQAERFHLAVQMHGSGVYSNPFTLLLGAERTAGFIRDGEPPGPLDVALPFPVHEPARRRALALAVHLGMEPAGEHTEFFLSPGDRRAAARLLEKTPAPLIGLHPGSREAAKLWPWKQFAAAGEAIRRSLGGTIAVIGGPEETEAGQAIVSLVGAPALNLAGRWTVPEMGAVVERLALLLTTDSAPAHIAYALGTPSVTLFGPTDPAVWGPPENPRHRCLTAEGGDISGISVQNVVKISLTLV